MDYHDVLAAFGAGSAHPGGFKGTSFWMDRLQLKEGTQVLEVGCGTGRTACALAQKFHVKVIGIDIRQAMVEKAMKRAQMMSLDPIFILTDHPNVLPFPDQSFDLVVAESVTVFNQIEALVSEYYRVLRPSGQLIDTEMAASSPLSPEILTEVQDLYGATRVPTLKEWKTIYQTAGFRLVQTIISGPVREVDMQSEVHDGMAVVSQEAFSKEASAIVDHNLNFMLNKGKWFQYGVFQAFQ